MTLAAGEIHGRVLKLVGEALRRNFKASPLKYSFVAAVVLTCVHQFFDRLPCRRQSVTPHFLECGLGSATLPMTRRGKVLA